MSKEQLKMFAEAVRNDEALQAQMLQLGADFEGIVALGQRQGYTFSTEELTDYANPTLTGGGRELSDEELGEVAGSGYTDSCVSCWG
jgi:predicted ribosomally synthesized peptide with nif11-like leader